MKPRSGLPAKSVIALAGMLAVSAGQANAAEKYANQEVSYAKPASQPATEQVQPPSNAPSNPAPGFTSAEGRSMSFELVRDSSGQPQQLGDTATHEVGHRSATRFLNARVLVWLGALSYPLYLVHQNVGYAVIAALEAAGLPAWAATALAICVALALAQVIHQFLEAPSLCVLRGMWNSRREQLATATS